MGATVLCHCPLEVVFNCSTQIESEAWKTKMSKMLRLTLVNLMVILIAIQLSTTVYGKKVKRPKEGGKGPKEGGKGPKDGGKGPKEGVKGQKGGKECEAITSVASYIRTMEEKQTQMDYKLAVIIAILLRSFGFTLGLEKVDFGSIGGEAGSTSEYTGDGNGVYAASKAFSGNGFWHSGVKLSAGPQSLWYKFPAPMNVQKFSFGTRGDNAKLGPTYGPSKYIFWGSNGNECSDASTWETLFENDSGTAFEAEAVHEVNNAEFYQCYGFHVLATLEGEFTTISKVQMYYSSVPQVEIAPTELSAGR